MTDWVRLWHDMPTDPKWRVIARKSGQPLPCVLAVFTMMLTNASGNAVKRGTLLTWDDEDAAAALDMEAEAVAAIRSAMQGKVLDGDSLTGWDRRQPKREDDSTNRVREHRKRKVEEAERDVTQRNAPDTETEEDTEKESKKITPPKGGQPLAFEGKVIRLNQSDFRAWKRNFPLLDIPAQLQSRDDWLALEADPQTRRKWFLSTSNHLANLQAKAASLERERASAAEMPC